MAAARRKQENRHERRRWEEAEEEAVAVRMLMMMMMRELCERWVNEPSARARMISGEMQEFVEGERKRDFPEGDISLRGGSECVYEVVLNRLEKFQLNLEIRFYECHLEWLLIGV